MNKKNILVILLVVVAAITIILIYKSLGVQRTFKAEVLKGLKRTYPKSSEIIMEEDIKGLPKPVQKYLTYVGVIGKEKVRNVRFVTETDMNFGSDKGWGKMKSEEYNFFDDNPTRLAFMKFKFKGIPVVGLDSYINGKGNMLIKPLGLITIANAKGHHMDDTSAAVLMFLNMCAVAPATLIDERIQWTTINEYTVKATFDDNRCKVSAILLFNDKGELIDFSTEDKYYSPTGESYEKVRWSTPVLNYKEINGLKLATYGEAIWHFETGDFCYGKVYFTEIQYNCK